jgi:Ser/Thr protein kinase RdoA (MazF antagonist)
MNDEFPITYSLLSSDALENFVERNYEIGRVTSCKLLTKGLNDTYREDSETGTFILRVYRTPWRSKSDINYELDVLNYLSENGVTVSAPIKSTGGYFAIEINAPEGERYLTLFTYANGSIPNLNEEVSYEYGILVARIHNLTDTFSSSHHRFHLDFNHLLE